MRRSLARSQEQKRPQIIFGVIIVNNEWIRTTDKYCATEWCRWTAYHFVIKGNTVSVLCCCFFFAAHSLSVSLSVSEPSNALLSVCAQCCVCVFLHFPSCFFFYFWNNSFGDCILQWIFMCVGVRMGACGRKLSVVVEWNVDSINIYTLWYLTKEAAFDWHPMFIRKSHQTINKMLDTTSFVPIKITTTPTKQAKWQKETRKSKTSKKSQFIKKR